MDDFLDNVFLSSPWPDINRSSWVGGTAAQTNELLADQVGGLYEGSERNIDLRTIPPNHIIGSAGELRHDSTSILNGGNSIYNLRKGFFHGVPQLQQEDLDHVSVPSGHDNVPKESKLSLQGYIEDNSRIGSLAIQLNTLPPVTLPQRSPGMPPGMPGSVGLNVNDASGLQQSLMASTSIAPLWDSPYTGVSIPSTIMGQGKLQGFGSRGEFGGSEAAILENKLQQPNSLASASDQMQDPSLPFAGASLMTLTRAAGMQHQQQLSQTVDANSLNYYTNHSVSQLQSPPQPASAGCAAAAAAVSCSGSAKPRVRARRGQATDPHSIAERLRREKIAERMKNLQELVPNSNKTDKASMLDEIIEYVKFLQLQVKVLSMSRLGAAGAVVPLITDVQSEGSNSLLLSASVGQGPDLSDSPDNIAFEQEVVKLMESNVTSAMQFLQTKSLCLMPIALAAAISGGKSSTNTFSCDRKKPTLPPDIVSPNGSFTSLGAHPPSSSESATHNENRDDASINGCTETIKQEEVYQSASNIRGSKPNA